MLTRHLTCVCSLVFVVFITAAAQSARASETSIVIPTLSEAAAVNEDTVGVVFTHEELFHRLVHDMEDVLEPVGGLRIVPVMGKNHVQSIYDLLYLKGIDLALVRADAVEYVKRKGNYATIESFVNSVAKVTEERLVLIAKSSITSVDDLAGKPVAMGVPGSGEYVTGTVAFDILGVDIEALELDGVSALDGVRSGEIAAMVYLLRAADSIQTGDDLRTARAVSSIDAEEDLHVIPLAPSDVLSDVYHNVTLTHDDLPGLVQPGESIDSYGVDVILAAYRWNSNNPRYTKTQRFVNAFMDGLESLQTGNFQPAWSRVKPEQDAPTVDQLPLVTQVLAEREAQEAIRMEALRAEQAAAAEFERQQRVGRIADMRDELNTLLDQKLDQSDSEELGQLLKQLNSILDTEGQN